MKIRKSDIKLNNKGFSLIELIVTMAIMIIMVVAATVTVSMLDSSYAEDAERGIKDYIAMGRTKSMSVSAKDWYVTVSKEDSSYYVYLYKVVLEKKTVDGVETTEEKTYLIEKEELGKKIDIEFGTSLDSTNDITSTNQLELHFDAATGKIKQAKLGPTNVAVTGGIGYFKIVRNDYVIKLKVFFNTGKCERE